MVLTLLLIVISGSDLLDSSESAEGLSSLEEEGISLNEEAVSINDEAISKASIDVKQQSHKKKTDDPNEMDVVYSSHMPLIIQFSLFLLWFGASGLISFDFISNKVLWISLTCGLTWGITYFFSELWKKVALNNQTRLYSGKELVGEIAQIKISTTNEGGIISIHTKTEICNLHAKTLHPLAYFYPGDEVYIVDFREGVYYVDQDRENIVHKFIKN